MSLIPEEIIAQVIDRTDIVETVSSYFPLRKAGANFKAVCPFHHEKTPSFIVNPTKQIFHCFGCGVGGNVVTFVMKQDHLEFPEAIRLLAKKANVEVPSQDKESAKQTNLRQAIFNVNDWAANYFHDVLVSQTSSDAKKARTYLKERSVDLKTVKDFRLGFAPNKWDGLISYLRKNNFTFSLMEKAGLIISKERSEGYYDRFRNRIIFPIFDTREKARAFGARTMDPSDGAKYINSPETPVYTKGHHLYGFHLAKKAIAQSDSIIIVEGYMDCLIPYQVGIFNIVASLGTALTVEQVRLIRRYTKNVTMLFDADTAGEMAMMRSLDTLIEEGMNVSCVNLEKGEDPDSFVRKFGEEAFRNKVNEAKTLFEYKLDILKQQHDARSVEGRAKISAQMLSTINKYNNEVIRFGYVKQLAYELSISEEALMTELKKVTTTSSYTSSRKVQAQTSNTNFDQQHRVVERNILKLLLEEESYIAITKEEINVVDFQDQKVRNVISRIYDWFEEGKEINVGSLISSFEDQSMQQMIAQLTANEEVVIGDKDKIHRDCINRMKSDRLKMLRQKIRQEIKEAENLGDMDKLNKLKTKFNQLIRG